MNSSVSDLAILGKDWNISFQEQFNNQVAFSNNWKIYNGLWEVNDGEFVGKSSYRNEWIVAYIDREFSGDIAICFDAYVTRPGTGIVCSIVRKDDSTMSGYILELGSMFNSFSTLIYNHQNVSVDKSLKLELNRVYRIILIRRGQKTTVYLDGIQKMSYIDKTWKKHKNNSRIFVGSHWGVPEIHFDNLYVYENPTPAPKIELRSDNFQPYGYHTDKRKLNKSDVYGKEMEKENYGKNMEQFSESVYVIGRLPQTPTNTSVRQGDKLGFIAKGSIKYSENISKPLDPKGSDDVADNILLAVTPICPEAPYGALIGKINDNGNWFYIGDRNFIMAPSSGKLYLGVNDNVGSFDDNEGAFNVAIEKNMWKKEF